MLSWSIINPVICCPLGEQNRKQNACLQQPRLGMRPLVSEEKEPEGLKGNPKGLQARGAETWRVSWAMSPISPPSPEQLGRSLPLTCLGLQETHRNLPVPLSFAQTATGESRASAQTTTQATPPLGNYTLFFPPGSWGLSHL